MRMAGTEWLRGRAKAALAMGMALTMLAGAWAAEKNEPAQPGIEDAFAALAARQVSDGRMISPMYLGYNGPHIIEAKGKIWTAFQNSTGRPVVMTYEPQTGRWDGPVLAADQGLENDDHGNPGMIFDRRGYLHVFYGSHGGPLRHARSTRPYDIHGWTAEPSPAPKATYPQLMRMSDGSLLLFYRAGGHPEPWSMRRSTDDGRSWSAEERVIEMRLDPPDKLACAYAQFLPGADGRTVHCFWTHKDDNAARVTPARPHPWRPLKYPGMHEAVYRYNIYYAKRDAQGAWRNAAGEKLALPVSKAAADKQCLVYDSGDAFTFIGAGFILDWRDRPYIKFGTGVVDWVKSAGGVRKVTEGSAELIPRTDRYATFMGGAWRVSRELPQGWPADVRRAIEAPGMLAQGEAWPGGHWFISHRRFPERKDFGSAVFLFDDRTGYIKHPDGPAGVDEKK